MKATISISDELLEKVDARAKELYVTRSAFITMALTQKFAADEAMLMMPALTQSINEAIALTKAKDEQKAIASS